MSCATIFAIGAVVVCAAVDGWAGETVDGWFGVTELFVACAAAVAHHKQSAPPT